MSSLNNTRTYVGSAGLTMRRNGIRCGMQRVWCTACNGGLKEKALGIIFQLAPLIPKLIRVVCLHGMFLALNLWERVRITTLIQTENKSHLVSIKISGTTVWFFLQERLVIYLWAIWKWAKTLPVCFHPRFWQMTPTKIWCDQWCLSFDLWESMPLNMSFDCNLTLTTDCAIAMSMNS